MSLPLNVARLGAFAKAGTGAKVATVLGGASLIGLTCIALALMATLLNDVRWDEFAEREAE